MVTPVGGVGGAGASALTQQVSAARPNATEAGEGFGKMVSDGLQSVSDAEQTADMAVQDLASGGDTRIEDVMIATTQAQLGIELMARVRDRALEAYQEVMRMPL